METNPDLTGTEVTDRPKNATVDDATVVQVIKGTQAELYELDEDEEPRYGSREDERIQLEIETTVNGQEFTVYEDMAYYDNPSDRSTFGKFIKRYKAPEPGMNVTVDFDEEGEASVIV